MKPLFAKFRNTRLKFRLSLPIIAALVFLLLSQWILYFFLTDFIRESLHSSADAVTASIRSHMDTRMRSIIERLYYVRLDPSIQDNLTDYLMGEDPSTEAVTMSEISYSLPLYKAAEPLLSSLLLYTPKRTFTSEGMPMQIGFNFESTELWQVLQDQSDQVVFVPPLLDEIFIMRRQVIPIMYRFKVEGYGEECVLVANLDQEKFTQYLLEALPSDGSQVLLVSESGEVIAGANNSAVAAIIEDSQKMSQAIQTQTLLDMELAGESYLVSACPMETAPWTIIYLQSKQAALSQISRLRHEFSAVTIMILLLSLTALTCIVDTVTTPLRKLCQQICSSENQHKMLDFQYPYQDEIGILAKSYNSMAKHIQNLLDEQQDYIQKLKAEQARADEEQKLKRQAELRALQSQINPHFLYNTLDSIRWKAEMAGATDISQMVTSLATLFRIGLSQGENIIPVSQEIRHVESYLVIQKMRYGDKISYTLDISPQVEHLYTVKLILQPLVENAIYHGIKESSHSGNVTISAQIDGDTLQLQVLDDGLGIPQQQLVTLQSCLASGYSDSREGYGIFNVNERIRLYFGEAYGLTLESEWGKGTRATLRLPRITVSEVNKYISHSDCG